MVPAPLGEDSPGRAPYARTLALSSPTLNPDGGKRGKMAQWWKRLLIALRAKPRLRSSPPSRPGWHWSRAPVAGMGELAVSIALLLVVYVGSMWPLRPWFDDPGNTTALQYGAAIACAIAGVLAVGMPLHEITHWTVFYAMDRRVLRFRWSRRQPAVLWSNPVRNATRIASVLALYFVGLPVYLGIVVFVRLAPPGGWNLCPASAMAGVWLAMTVGSGNDLAQWWALRRTRLDSLLVDVGEVDAPESFVGAK